MSSRSQTPYKIGITGGIACGKSLVRKILDKMDIPTIDADEIVHDLLQKDEVVISQITDIFGDYILKEDGGVDRKTLAKIVFTNQQKLKQLEGIIHPQTYRAMREFIKQCNSDIVGVVIPLLFENHRQHMFDSVWLITATEEQQIERLKLRDGMSEDEAKQRIYAQMPQNLKMAMADEIIDNSYPIEELEPTITDIINRLRQNQFKKD